MVEILFGESCIVGLKCEVIVWYCLSMSERLFNFNLLASYRLAIIQFVLVLFKARGFPRVFECCIALSKNFVLKCVISLLQSRKTTTLNKLY